ncbi:MAG: thioredoxin [Planctomycetota bacterium]|nr:MAG: thioredoxin [Planctomycetota bacterium]
MVRQLKSSDFDEFVGGSELPVVVDFWAEWCPPCKFLAPIFERLAERFAGKVEFVKVDVDVAPDVAARFGIYAIPTLILLKDGKEVARQEGALPEEVLVEWIKSKAGVEE